jgi:hypothetical protein
LDKREVGGLIRTEVRIDREEEGKKEKRIEERLRRGQGHPLGCDPAISGAVEFG